MKKIDLIFSSIRQPQSIIVERVNRELGRFFRTFLKEKHTGWAQYVNIIQRIINETYHETTEFTPLELHLNIKPQREWKSWINTGVHSEDKSHEEKIYLAKERITRKGRKRAERFNKNKSKLFIEFKIGDEVLIRSNNVSDMEQREIAKFFSIYEGPYKVQRKIGESTYFLIDEINEQERGRFHVSDLKKYRRNVENL